MSLHFFFSPGVMSLSYGHTIRLSSQILYEALKKFSKAGPTPGCWGQNLGTYILKLKQFSSSLTTRVENPKRTTLSKKDCIALINVITQRAVVLQCCGLRCFEEPAEMQIIFPPETLIDTGSGVTARNLQFNKILCKK